MGILRPTVATHDHPWLSDGCHPYIALVRSVGWARICRCEYPQILASTMVLGTEPLWITKVNRNAARAIHSLVPQYQSSALRCGGKTNGGMSIIANTFHPTICEWSLCSQRLMLLQPCLYLSRFSSQMFCVGELDI